MVKKQLGDRLEALSTSALTNSAATSSMSLPTSSACFGPGGNFSTSPSPSPSTAGSLADAGGSGDKLSALASIDLFPRGNAHIALVYD